MRCLKFACPFRFPFDTTLGSDPDGYDDDDRLTYWKRSDNNLTHEWTLTDVGDWSALKTNGTSVSRTHSDAHELTSIGSSSLTYDVKGNLTNDPIKNQTYTWDFDNRLSFVDRAVSDLTARYDALGRRVQWGHVANMETYVYSGQQVIAAYASGANPTAPRRRYVFGSYVDEPILTDYKSGSTWDLYYYSRNQQYSVTALTDDNGNVVERYCYDAHGTPSIYAADGTTSRPHSSYLNKFMFTGRWYFTSIKFYYFRARMYDPTHGRFLNRDPLGYVDGMSLYRGYFSVEWPRPTRDLQVECRTCPLLAGEFARLVFSENRQKHIKEAVRVETKKFVFVVSSKCLTKYKWAMQELLQGTDFDWSINVKAV